MISEHVDVLIIGAGPAGAVAASLLRQRGHGVLIIEKQEFPRFAVGESLLPQSMHILEEAGMLRDVVEAGFQHKNGTAFAWNGAYTEFNFRDKTSEGWGTSYHVRRDEFDDILSSVAERAGAEVRFCHEVVAVDLAGDRPRAMVRTPDGRHVEIKARFMLDASGSACVLTRLTGAAPVLTGPSRTALVAYARDRVAADVEVARGRRFDRHKSLYVAHPERADTWYWVVPLADGWSSVGAVFGAGHPLPATDAHGQLKSLIDEAPLLTRLLGHAEWKAPTRRLALESHRADAWVGRGYALLGNAAVLPDPAFCSGTTLALKSASLAADAVDRELSGEAVDWRADYAVPLSAGVAMFESYVDAWYAGSLRDIVFESRQQPQVRRMISAALAGYAWDADNPLARDAARRLRALHQLVPSASLTSAWAPGSSRLSVHLPDPQGIATTHDSPVAFRP